MFYKTTTRKKFFAFEFVIKTWVLHIIKTFTIMPTTTLEALSAQHDNPWATVIAPYLAERVFLASKNPYADPRMIPHDIHIHETIIPTVLLKSKSIDDDYRRVYLWLATQEQAENANCDRSGDIGTCSLVQTTLPHDMEFYDKFEIIQESDPTIGGVFAHERINKILSTQHATKVDEDVEAAAIQSGVEAFVLQLMTDEDWEVVAIYTTKRTLRRGMPTLFEDVDVLVGDMTTIRDLGEESDSDDAADSDYADSGHAEATDFILKRMKNLDSDENEEEDPAQEVGTDMDEDEEHSEGSDDDELFHQQITDVVEVHNELVTLLDDKGALINPADAPRFHALLAQLRSVGTIELDSEGSTEEDTESTEDEESTEEDEEKDEMDGRDSTSSSSSSDLGALSMFQRLARPPPRKDSIDSISEDSGATEEVNIAPK